MAWLSSLVPDVEVMLALEAPELAGPVLELLNAEQKPVHRGNFTMEHENNPPFHGYPRERWPEIARQVCEAWDWLTAHGLIAIGPDVHHYNSHYFVTRLGKRIAGRAGLITYRKALELPKDRLHPTIADRCFSQFVRGEFDTAVFQAFKTLEVRIREGAGLPHSAVGVQLAREAFNPTTGKLTDPKAEGGERQALSDLMAGALGSYKNPTSHRHVALSAEEAAEMVILASHLLRIVDARCQ